MSQPDELNDAERLLLSRFPRLLAVTDPGLREEMLGLVRLIAGSLFKTERDTPYAAAVITIIDREDAQIRSMFYPITRVELQNIHPDRMPTRYRVFIATEDGWTEEQ